ncbi:MAG: PilZ domain-containing protein [Acidobacteriia bacterium]|nr:PilZ domain-containing protein [Terriglobia bacterium]
MVNFQHKLRIEVFGTDLDGRQFIEQTQTLTITRDGATIPLAYKLSPESELIVRNLVTNEKAVARVADLIQDANFAQVYGVAFIDPSVNLRQIDFPEVQFPKTVIMECSRCHAVDAILLSEIEMEILESKQTLTRYCECRKSSTIWKQTDRRVTERRATEREVSDRQPTISPPIEESTAPDPHERRRNKRTAMNVPACIRSNGKEVVVECEDVSCDGFRFKSRTAYPAGLSIEAAAPYAKSSVNIFVSALIAYQQELSGGFYRHGVAYVASITKPSSKS